MSRAKTKSNNSYKLFEPKYPMEIKNEINLKKGAATFLDVLGWKGIWIENRQAINILHSLVQETIKKAKSITFEYMENDKLRGNDNLRGRDNFGGIDTNVLSISDTIALFTSGPAEIAIEIHAKICSWLLEYAFKQKIPLRGAISYGEYSIKENIMLGYAVDEAASWHEKTDWIGVILTPSAKFAVGTNKLQSITTYDQIPFKSSIKNLNLCVDWSYQDKADLFKIIQSKGPHTPEIAPKYLNTLSYFNYRENEQLKKINH